MPSFAWQQWVLIVYFILGGVSGILMVGRERKPITPGTATAIATISTTAALIVASM